MKNQFLMVAVLATSFSAFAGPGEHFVDKKLFKSLQERYNGTWTQSMEGTVSAEHLKDQSLLVEMTGQLAEFTFYNIPKAKEVFLNIPSFRGMRWVNYYDRNAASIKCGGRSMDLKNDPFMYFKCRFAVDKQGEVKFFEDRSAETSNGKPQYDDGREVPDGWEGDTLDFRWRQLQEIKGSTANVYNDSGFRVREGNTESFEMQFFGDVALALYEKLDVAPVKEWWGPFPHDMKYGRQIWCAYDGEGPEKFAKCRIRFGFDGVALAPEKSN